MDKAMVSASWRVRSYTK